MILDRGFLHVSEVGTARNKIGVCVEIAYGPVAEIPLSVVDGHQIIAEEFSEGPCGEAAW